MTFHWPNSFNLLPMACSIALFCAGGHFAATALIDAQQTRQLEELSTVALRRSETVGNYATNSLAELTDSAALDCDPASLQALRLHVYQRGSLKDIRVADHSGAVLCSAYSETLEFDNGRVTRDEMLPTADPSLRMFRVDQFFGTALGVMKDHDAAHSLIAIVALNGALFDIMPSELREHSDVTLQLDNGLLIAHAAGSERDSETDDWLTLSAHSALYPFKASVTVKRAALMHWGQEPYAPIVALSALLGALFGVVGIKALRRQPTPTEELDRAIAAQEFSPFFQPIFDLESGGIVGAEMLARWLRADGTIVPPSRFIELAEDSGRIATITWQLLSSALRDLQPLMRVDKAFKLSVNIAPRQFLQAGFVDELHRVVAHAGVSARQVTLELTEREGFADLDLAAAIVARVHEHGFKVALDDVGIGHSGLSHIQKLGVDTLKVDKFFVDSISLDASANIVVEMLVRLGRDLRMGLIAEGIENAEQVEALLACGIRQGQGFLVSQPLPLGGFLTLLEARRRGRDNTGRAAA